MPFVLTALLAPRVVEVPRGPTAPTRLYHDDESELLAHARMGAHARSQRARAASVEGCAGAGEEPEPPETVDELRERIADILARYDVPGLGLALVDRAGTMWAGGVGVADRARGVEVDADTVFRVGSVSKTFIALAIMTLVEDGRLTLDTPIHRLAPEIVVTNPWRDTHPITVAHLLEHSAGFDDIRFNELFVAPGADDAPLAEVLSLNPRSRASRWSPGSRFSYSNPGYTVAGYLIEKVTGETFEGYVQRRVLAPLGMTTASFTRTPSIDARLAQGYGSRRAGPLPYRRIHHRPAGELMASPAELAALVRLLLGRGTLPGRGKSAPRRVVSPISIARMERSETRVGPLLDTAYGLAIAGDRSLPVLTRGHDGGLPGFVSEYRYAPSLGVGYVLLFNSSAPTVGPAYAQIRRLVFEFLTRGRHLPEPPTVELPRDALTAHAGYYELTSPRNEVAGFLERVMLGADVVVLRERGLHMTLGNGLELDLIPTAPGRFRFPGYSGPSIAFDIDADGRRIMRLGDLAYEEGNRWHGLLRHYALSWGYSLLEIGAFWNFIWLPAWLFLVVRTRRRMALPPGAPPALAAMCFVAMLRIFIIGLEAGALGQVNALSVGFFGLGLAFPLLSGVALVYTIRSLRPPHRERMEASEAEAELSGMVISLYQRGWRARIYDIATSAACVGMSLYLTYHGIIGLRTWTW